ncbi:DC1 [Dillenia turbinata]|uniref:DC1 n=1 Tax=Dillenia turbinata TaxID=194707 RepID=A0AAN8Z950_9MAGN
MKLRPARQIVSWKERKRDNSSFANSTTKISYHPMKYTEIKHSSHHHTLLLKLAKTPYICDGCKELGFGTCFQCEACNFDLHKECALPNSHPSSHPLLKKCQFDFYESKGDRFCDACAHALKGYMYQCSNGVHDLHPSCLNLETKLRSEGVTLRLVDRAPSRCLKCDRREISKRVSGWAYVSSHGKYCYHVTCVKKMILDKWEEGYFVEKGDVFDPSGLAMQSIVTNQDIGVHGGRSSSSSKVRKYVNMAFIVLKLIISSIFGSPIDGISALIQPLLFGNQ